MSRFRRRQQNGSGGSKDYGGDGDDSGLARKKPRRSNLLDLAAGGGGGRRSSSNNKNDDESVASHSSSEASEHDHDSDDVEEEETLDAKKVRLAREYLRKIEAADDDGDDSDSKSSSDESSKDGDDDDEYNDGITRHSRIGLKLQRERLKQDGTYERAIADKVHASLNKVRASFAPSAKKPSDGIDVEDLADDYSEAWLSSGHVRLFRGHDLTPTCVALQSDGQRAISGSKDHSVLIWDVQEERKGFVLCPDWKHDHHQEQQQQSSTSFGEGSRTRGEVLSVACSDDGRYAAVGRRDATVCIYDIRLAATTVKNNRGDNLVQTFTGHKGPVTSLAFRSQSLELFSASDDRCLRQYNLSEMMYLETLYGHQFGVTSVDCHRKERPVSVGRDRTARVWKISEDTHLIFRGGAKVSSADCVRIMKDDWFLTGHDDGHLSLWMSEKKRAVASIENAHGVDTNLVGRGVSAIGSLRGSDLAITGSCDGFIRLWKADTGSTLDSRGLRALDKVPMRGHVNALAVGPKAKFCVAAVGQEPRLGRWNRISGAKNRFAIIKLRSDDDVGNEDSSVDEKNESRDSDESDDSDDRNVDSGSDEE
jgi:ribosomal RNA-processing protein 9